MKTINNAKIIGIDHGYGNMKTANFCFPTGITTYDHEPLFTADMLVYGGKYFGIVQRRNLLKLRHLRVAYSLCPAGRVLHRNKQGLCVPKSQSKSATKVGFTLWGLTAPKPPKRRDAYGERYTNRRACHGKRKR